MYKTQKAGHGKNAILQQATKNIGESQKFWREVMKHIVGRGPNAHKYLGPLSFSQIIVNHFIHGEKNNNTKFEKKFPLENQNNLRLSL